MKNILIHNMNKKNLNSFVTNFGLWFRKKINKPFRKLCNIFTSANIIDCNNSIQQSDDEYYRELDLSRIPDNRYNLKGKNDIVLERYPKLEDNESYIFVANHSCPEDIETILNVLDRNTFLVLGSLETLQYDPEMYLSWLNGMIPFDILNDDERKLVYQKMLRVIKTNSILIFPEGSHNYHPNKLINNLFDGPINLSLDSGKKICIVTFYKNNNISYIDVSNPIDISKMDNTSTAYMKGMDINQKNIVKAYSSYIRDKMATALYHMIVRHSDMINRSEYDDITTHFVDSYLKDSFEKMNWNKDIFEAEFLTKKTSCEREYEEVNRSISNLILNKKTLINTGICTKQFVLNSLNDEKINVVQNMRKELVKQKVVNESKKKC